LPEESKREEDEMSLSRRPDAGVPPPPPPPPFVAEKGEEEEVVVRVVVEDDVLLRTRDRTAISGQFSVVSMAAFPSPPPPFSPLPPCRVEGKEDEEKGLSHSPPRGASCTLCVRRSGKSMGARFRAAS